MGIFVGYAGYYFVRKYFSLAMPDLVDAGFSITELGFALSGVSIPYSLSKFLMGRDFGPQQRLCPHVVSSGLQRVDDVSRCGLCP